MAKLTKHAEVLEQLHSMVKKQAEEAQKNVSGKPGGDVKSVSVGSEHDTTNKNSVGPENVAQGYHQKPSEDSAEPLAGSKTANDLGAEILDIIRKQAEAQDSVTGKPGDVKSESTDEHKTDKNKVKPENNSQDYEQKPSTDSSKPLDSAKKAEVEELAAKVASYELGRQFCAALLKTAAEQQESDELEMMKEAGRRDFDLMIAEAAENLETAEAQEKQAEFEGAAHFDALMKQAAYEEALQQNNQLQAKLAEYEAYIKQAEENEYAQIAAIQAQEQQVKLAESVADIVLSKLKSEIVPNAQDCVSLIMPVSPEETKSLVEEQAINALSHLSDKDKDKVLRYIESLVNLEQVNKNDQTSTT